MMFPSALGSLYISWQSAAQIAFISVYDGSLFQSRSSTVMSSYIMLAAALVHAQSNIMGDEDVTDVVVGGAVLVSSCGAILNILITNPARIKTRSIRARKSMLLVIFFLAFFLAIIVLLFNFKFCVY